MKKRYLTEMVFIVTLFMAFSGSSAYALEPFSLYDDFSSTFIDESRWFGQESLTTGVNILEDVRQIVKGRLHMLSRIYGNTGSDTGDSAGRNRLQFVDPDPITAVKATVQVMGLEATGCPGNTSVTKARAGLFGTFFNTGTPTAGSFLNDVQAYIAVERRSDSTDPPGTFQVLGYVIKCSDATCFLSTELSSQTLGTVKAKKKTDLSIQWDKTNHQFIFQLGSLPPVSYSYGVSDTSSPGSQTKRLDLNNRIANCTAEPRPLAFADVYFDDVLVNQSAAP